MCSSKASSQRTVVRALCVCAHPSVFKLHAHYTACDNGGPTVKGASAALWCVSFLRHTHLLITHSLVSTCSFIICLGQQTLVTQREVNVKQTVYLLHCWQPSALFARCIRHSWWTALAELHPLGYSLRNLTNLRCDLQHRNMHYNNLLNFEFLMIFFQMDKQKKVNIHLLLNLICYFSGCQTRLLHGKYYALALCMHCNVR